MGALECLNVVVTNRCPLMCAHCGPRSGPAERGAIDDGIVATAFRSARARGCGLVNVTGGEPFVEREVVLRLLDAARRNCLASRITTSAFWATSKDHAARFLEPFANAGLGQLCLSRSAEHAEFVPADRLAFAAAAARLHRVTVILVFSGRAGADRDRRELLDAFGRHRVAMPRLFESSIIPFGRAEEHVPATSLLLRPVEALTRPCGSVGRNPTIYTDGTVTACGVVFGSACAALHVGSVTESSFDALADQMSTNSLVRFISEKGPFGLKTLVEANSDLRFSSHYANICHLCGDILMNQAALHVVRSHVDAAI